MELANLRKEIDTLDRDIIKLLSKRFSLVDKIAEQKKVLYIEAHQP
jgi:chorismate mutase